MRDSPQPGRPDGRARADRVSQMLLRDRSDQGRYRTSHGDFSGRINDTGRDKHPPDLSGLTNALAQTWICAPRVTGESPGSIPAPLPIVGGGRRQVGWVAPLDLRDVGPRRANFFRESRLRPAHQRPFLLDIATHPGRFHIPILDRSRYLTSP